MDVAALRSVLAPEAWTALLDLVGRPAAGLNSGLTEVHSPDSERVSCHACVELQGGVAQLLPD